MSPSSRRRTEDPPSLDALGSSRRRVLQFGATALAGSLAGCTSGVLGEGSDATESEPTTLPVGADTSLPEGSVEFPEGPKSPPERPSVLARESVREYVHAFEYRYVYNELHTHDSTAVHAECGVDSVEEYGEGFRVVVRCSTYSNAERNGSTMHADYFARYATYYVGPNSTVRREGRSDRRE